VAHSITLAFAALGIASAPQPPIEALVALSSMFVASEIIRSGQGRFYLSSRYPWLISSCSVCCTGSGSGSAVPARNRSPLEGCPARASHFKLGVEAGQLVFVVVVLLAMACMKLLLVVETSRLRFWLAYLIGTLSAFWFVQRIVGFG
jgi:hypothetical protein